MATNRQEGFFQRNLPKMGFALNTVTSVASGVVDLGAARIVSKSAGAGLAAGVLGTVSGIVVNWLIFLFSNVQEDYAEMGKVLDEKLSSQGDLIRSEEKIKNNRNKTSYNIIFAQIGLSGAVLITTGLNAVSQYQEIQSLASSARDEGMDCPAEAAFWFGLCLAAMNGTSDFLTCNSFANLAIASMISRKSSETQIDRKHDIESNEYDEILGSEGSNYQTFGGKYTS